MPPAVDVPAVRTDRNATPTGPRASLWALRGIALAQTAVMLGQPVFAGLYLDGDVDALDIHSLDGNLLPLLALVQIVVAAAYFFAGRGRGWPALFSIGLFLAEGVQIGMGYARQLGIHIPLGVTIVVTQVLFTVWMCRRGARRTRPRRDESAAPAAAA